METLRKALGFSENSGNGEHGDILAIKVAKLMALGRSWWTVEDYKRASKFDKFILYFTISGFIWFSISSTLNCILNPQSEPSLNHILERVFFSLICLISVFGVSWLNWKRESISRVILVLNSKSLAILKSDDSPSDYQEQRNGIQSFCIGLLMVCLILTFLVWVSFDIQYMLIGRAPFYVFFASNHLLAYIQYFLQKCCLFWAAIHFPPFYAMIIEIFLMISLNYRALGYYLRNIRNWEEKHVESRNISRFKFFMQYFSELQELMDDMNSVLCAYIPPFVGITINTTGLFVANVAKAESYVEALPMMFLPLWMFSYLAIFCILGEIVKKSAAKVQEAAYSCEWFAAPIEFRKLLLMFLTRCQRETIIDVKPFFVLNYELLAKFLKCTYALIALMLNVS